MVVVGVKVCRLWLLEDANASKSDQSERERARGKSFPLYSSGFVRYGVSGAVSIESAS